MDLHELKLVSLGIQKESLGRIAVFVDFGNVNYWYADDERDASGGRIPKGHHWIVDIERLGFFVSLFSPRGRFYYGLDKRRPASIHIINLARKQFIVVTKLIQWVRHYLADDEQTDRNIVEDLGGKFIRIPKCNFDVEITLDAVRLMKEYDTLCLFSGDSDFAHLLQFLQRRGKKIILVHAGHIDHRLKDAANIQIQAQSIKVDIAALRLKTPRVAGRGLDIGSATGGQGSARLHE